MSPRYANDGRLSLLGTHPQLLPCLAGPAHEPAKVLLRLLLEHAR
jgi:hypothetical protein